MKLQQVLSRTDSPSERPASSSRRPPERENVPPSLRPTEPRLQRRQETKTAVKTLYRSPDFWHFNLDIAQFLSTASVSGGELTLHTSFDGFEGAGSYVRRVRRFNQVTGVWIRQDGQQVAIPRPLHHFLNLERGRNKRHLICQMAK